ncbi:protein crumbs-like [Branchiostoma floridae]|uniref:Protein crumbs-like n=1 Tax=Branchiostoma floridae TaxID=7739 RepID=A0A9J7KXD5_BRAFL|nr:protein crumbs-like [Branchiostoma floridae]
MTNSYLCSSLLVLNSAKCFQLSVEPKPHLASEGECTTRGGALAGVKTVAEQEFLTGEIRLGTDVSHWIGLKNGPEQFLYTDLSTMSSQLRWMPGKPENLCALLDKNGNYDLNADFCTEQYNYVCESDVVTCKQNVCLNGGNCTSCFNESYAYCECAPGFVGDRCDINVDECPSDSCQYAGRGVDGVNSYTCQCVPGFTGDDCENAKDVIIAGDGRKLDPVAVVDAMEHALCATRPRSRYVVGWDAWLVFVPISWLPTDLGDLVLRVLSPKITPACCRKDGE